MGNGWSLYGMWVESIWNVGGIDCGPDSHR